MPDGQIVAFSSNGCNEASCHASFHADGTALISVLGLTWKLSVSSNGSTTIQPHSSYPAVIFTADNDRGYESSDEGSSGSVELVGAPTVGAGYTLKVAANLSTKDMAGSPTISVGVDMTGVVTEVQ